MKITQVAAVTGSAVAVLGIAAGIALASSGRPAPVRQIVRPAAVASTVIPVAAPSAAVAVRPARPAVVAPKVATSTPPTVQEPTVTTTPAPAPAPAEPGATKGPNGQPLPKLPVPPVRTEVQDPPAIPAPGYTGPPAPSATS